MNVKAGRLVRLSKESLEICGTDDDLAYVMTVNKKNQKPIPSIRLLTVRDRERFNAQPDGYDFRMDTRTGINSIAFELFVKLTITKDARATLVSFGLNPDDPDILNSSSLIRERPRGH